MFLTRCFFAPTPSENTLGNSVDGACAKDSAEADANMAAALDGDEETFWQAPAEARTGAIEVQFSKPVRVDRAVALEWLNEGQRVESYVIEAWRNGAWKRLVSGQAIGHRKVDAFPAVTASRFRLRILSGAGSIRIREFQLFDSGVEGQPAKTSR